MPEKHTFYFQISGFRYRKVELVRFAKMDIPYLRASPRTKLIVDSAVEGQDDCGH